MISVIVPIYKVELYLDRCIKSIVEQTYKDLEIILIDDGSPDKCPEICDKWAEKDNRIKVIHNKNMGVSLARNAGLDAATGDYISFVDSDDYINKNMYQILHDEIVKKDVDMVGYLFDDVDEQENVIKRTAHYFEKPDFNKKYSGREYAEKLLDNKFLGVIWDKLYKKELIGDLRFVGNIYAEDLVFDLEILKEDTTMVFVENVLYYYTAREESTTGGFNEKYNYDMVKVTFDMEKNLLKRFGDDIKINIKTAQLKSIRLFLVRVPYTYVKKRNKSYMYVLGKLKENKEHIFKNNNSFPDKMFLYMFLKSKKITKLLIPFVNTIVGI